jgi:hypothetical protein
MVSPIVHQSDTAVQTTRPEVIYRADVTGRICRAFVLKEYDESLKVQGDDYRGDVRIIRRDTVLNWITAESAPEASKSAVVAPQSDLPAPQPLHVVIQPVDPASALDRYSALAAKRYAEWQAEKNYLGAIPLVSGDQEQLCRILEAHARYGAAMRHVERLNGTKGNQSSARPTVKAGDVFTALAIAALVELGVGYYTAAPDMSASLRDAVQTAIEAGQLDFCMDVVGTLPHAVGRGVQTVNGNRRYQWAAQS